MTAILQFRKKHDDAKQSFAPGHSATILLYTGVRFERIDFDAIRCREGLDAELLRTQPARLAN